MKKIENITAEILMKRTNYNPLSHVEIIPIIEDDGLEISVVDMRADKMGCLIVDSSRDIRRIEIKSFSSSDESIKFKKSRFILAYEYGYYKLHIESSNNISRGMSRHHNTIHKNDIQEQEAAYFARSILMPKYSFKSFYECFRKDFPQDIDRIVECLSILFQVTKQQIDLRINDLIRLREIWD